MLIQQLIDDLLSKFKLHKNFYILAHFSQATEDLINLKEPNTKFKYLVYSIQIIPYTSLSKAAVTRLKFFNLPYINIIQIRDYFKTPEGRPLQWEYTDDSTDKNWIRIAQYSYPDFFNEELLHFFFNSENLDRTYFLFHSSLWFIILSYFRNNNYILSGGSLQNRGICSPLHQRMCRFLEIYELECPRGYHGKLSPILKSQIDFKSEFGKEKYEEIKLRISKDFEDKQNTNTNNQLDKIQESSNKTNLNSPFNNPSNDKKECIQFTYADPNSSYYSDTDSIDLDKNKSKQNNKPSNSDTNSNSTSSTPFGIKGQNRKFHSSTYLLNNKNNSKKDKKNTRYNK